MIFNFDDIDIIIIILLFSRINKSDSFPRQSKFFFISSPVNMPSNCEFNWINGRKSHQNDFKKKEKDRSVMITHGKVVM